MRLPEDWTVQFLMDVDHRPMAKWIESIPFEAWPQQSPFEDGQLQPAMVNDLDWRPGFRREAADILFQIAPALHAYHAQPICRNHMLSVVMPGRSIPPHADRQLPTWLCRVHVPLVADDQSKFIVEGEPHTMHPGAAYLVNVLRTHEVRNQGAWPRIHFMFDVLQGETR